MSVYMTEEEQLDAIKQWWKKHSNTITLLLSAVLLLVAGYRYWTWHQEKVTVQASVAYEKMIQAYTNKNAAASQSYANQLISEYGKTSYADTARMVLAKQLVEKSQYVKARAQLEHVAHHAHMPALQRVARTRLARLLLADKQYDLALKELDAINDTAYEPMVNELKGDIYSAKGDANKALGFYTQAVILSKKNKASNSFLEMKANELAWAQPKSVARNSATQHA